MKWFIAVGGVILSLMVWSDAQAVDLRLRLGQGGLHDSRAPDGKLGGGLLALDVKLGRFPLVVSIATEYYKKSPRASHPYEIDGMLVGYLLYRVPLHTAWSSDAYVGCGIGWLEVPGSEGDETNMESAIAFDAACGISAKVFWRIGVFVEAKYIYSRKTTRNVRVVDFSNFGALVGLSLDFGFVKREPSSRD